MRRPLSFDGGLNNCFGCGPENALGLRLRFFETDDGVELDYVVPAHFAGPPGAVHGGIQATLLDEVLCMTAYAKRGTGVVTGELTVRYLRPAPTDTPLVVRGRIVEDLADSFVIAGGIHVAATDDLVARGRGRFFPKRFA
jgi:uncharacterized protein (TIGR00369 family)